MQDFNTAQRHAFCVYSGKGVSQLRTYLTELFDRITEMNNTDDTEYEEDDFDGEGYQEDDTPEPETVTEIREMEGYPRQHMLYNPNVTSVQGHHADFTQQLPHAPLPQAHEFPFQRDRPIRSANIPMTTVNRNDIPDVSISPTSNLRGATSRLNAQIQAGTPTPGAARQGRVHHLRHGRTVADVLPVVESSSSQSHDDHMANDNGAGFFSRQDRPNASAISPRGSRALTPDLNYAEIGHGRGAQASSSTPRGQTLTRERTARQTGSSQFPQIVNPHAANVHGHSDFENDQLEDVLIAPEHATPVAPALETAWVQRESAMIPHVDDDMHDFTEVVTEQQRGRKEHPGGQMFVETQPRARSVKRTFRNTLTAAEHYASSLFGRPGADHRSEAGGSGHNTGVGPDRLH